MKSACAAMQTTIVASLIAALMPVEMWTVSARKRHLTCGLTSLEARSVRQRVGMDLARWGRASRDVGGQNGGKDQRVHHLG